MRDYDLNVCSPLIEGAWAGGLVHLSGLDVVGATAGSLARFFQDREVELWENKRVVADASPEEVCLSASCPIIQLIFYISLPVASCLLCIRPSVSLALRPSLSLIKTGSEKSTRICFSPFLASLWIMQRKHPFYLQLGVPRH